MLQVILEIPETASLKDKRRTVLAIKSRLQSRFKLSCAEVDLLDSIRFAHLGAALVSNSREHGEAVMQKALAFIEDGFALRVHDAQIHSEQF